MRSPCQLCAERNGTPKRPPEASIFSSHTFLSLSLSFAIIPIDILLFLYCVDRLFFAVVLTFIPPCKMARCILILLNYLPHPLPVPLCEDIPHARNFPRQNQRPRLRHDRMTAGRLVHSLCHPRGAHNLPTHSRRAPPSLLSSVSSTSPVAWPSQGH
jgi:hypothetical protein